MVVRGWRVCDHDRASVLAIRHSVRDEQDELGPRKPVLIVEVNPPG